MSISVKTRPFAYNDIKLHARGKILLAAANAAAAKLRSNIAPGPRSGTISQHGRPVSVWPEFPQYQTGELYRSVDVRRGGNQGYQIGFFDVSNEKKLREIEFNPPEKGGRAPLARTLESDETRNAMADAIAQAEKL